MSNKDEIATWMQEKQLELEAATIGSNKVSVKESLSDHRHIISSIESFKKEVEKESAKSGSKGGSELKKSFNSLVEQAVKQKKCLETLSDLQSLEDLFGNISNDIATKSVFLTKDLNGVAVDGAKPGGCHGVNAYQNCILSLKNNWAWLGKLMKCSETHLNHASDYHQFFHSIHELSQWMPADLEKASELLSIAEMKSNLHGDVINQLLREIKTALTIFLRWHTRLNMLLQQSKSLVPVQLRTQSINQPRPSFALANYNTKDITLQEGEEVTLLDNSKIQTWKVRNLKGEEYEVPSVILMIPGPDAEALQQTLRLMLEFLSLWTTMVKRYGKTIILFLLHVIRIWTTKEEELLKSLPENEKQEIRKLLTSIEKTFSPFWDSYPPYEELKKRMNHLRSLLSQRGSQTGASKDSGSLLVIQTDLLEELLSKYREFWRNWETYKILTESTQHPELLLSVTGWDQYHFLQLSEWQKKWQTTLELEDSDFDEFGRTVLEEQIHLERAKETAETSQMFSSEQEENQTFVITGVTDPETGEQISLDEAVAKGVINQSEGKYVKNLKTGESMPIPVAMNAGKIKVELITVKKSKEKIKDVGVITIKIIKETRPYILKGVKDSRSFEVLSVDEATKLGILNQKTSQYKDLATGNVISLSDALESGLLVVDYKTDAGFDVEPVIETKTYAVNTIVDQKTRKAYTFSEAIRAGLFNPDTGSYHDSLKGRDIYIGDAIKEGYVNAIVIKDPASITADPTNMISISEDKLQFFKQAFLEPLKALNMFNIPRANGHA